MYFFLYDGVPSVHSRLSGGYNGDEFQDWIDRFPAQCILAAAQMSFTAAVPALGFSLWVALHTEKGISTGQRPHVRLIAPLS